jgi:hypothetical protein
MKVYIIHNFQNKVLSKVLLLLSLLFLLTVLLLTGLESYKYLRNSRSLKESTLKIGIKIDSLTNDLKKEIISSNNPEDTIIPSVVFQKEGNVIRSSAAKIIVPDSLNLAIGPFNDNDPFNIYSGTSFFESKAKRFIGFRYKSIIYNIVGIVFNPFEIRNGKLYINASINDFYNNNIARIVDNKIYKNPNYKGTVNFDKNGIEVIDSLGFVAFSLDIKPNNLIIYQGYIVNQENKAYLVVGMHSQVSNRNSSQSSDEFKSTYQQAKVQKIFDYSDPKILGKRGLPLKFESD